MKSYGILAASLFGALVAAAPVNKRDVVWVTEMAVDVVTVPVTMTVWVGADDATTSTAVPTAPTVNSNFAHQPKTRHTLSSTSTVAVPASSSTVEVAPTTSTAVVEPTTVYVEPTTSSTSVYVEPTTSSTSVYVAPTTTTSAYVAPTTTEAPTSTYVAPSSTSSAPAATSSASSGATSGSAASGTSYTGDLTYYATGLGACGITNTASDHIVAISQTIFDAPEYATANSNNNPLCGKYVSITGSDGTAYQAKVVDRCVGCATADLDLSEDFFKLVEPTGDGRVHNVKWTWV